MFEFLTKCQHLELWHFWERVPIIVIWRGLSGRLSGISTTLSGREQRVRRMTQTWLVAHWREARQMLRGRINSHLPPSLRIFYERKLFSERVCSRCRDGEGGCAGGKGTPGGEKPHHSWQHSAHPAPHCQSSASVTGGLLAFLGECLNNIFWTPGLLCQ